MNTDVIIGGLIIVGLVCGKIFYGDAAEYEQHEQNKDSGFYVDYGGHGV